MSSNDKLKFSNLIDAHILTILDGTSFTHYDDFFGGGVDMEAVMYLMLANHLLHSFYPSFVITIAEVRTNLPTIHAYH